MKPSSLKDTFQPTQRVITIGTQVGLIDAWRVMREHGVHHLVVVEGGTILGLLDSRDLFDRGLTGDGILPPDRTVGEVMVPTRVTLTDRSDLREALDLMRASGTTALPLVRHGGLIGVVTETDLLRVMSGVLDQEKPTAHTADKSYALLSNPLVQNLMDLLGQAGI